MCYDIVYYDIVIIARGRDCCQGGSEEGMSGEGTAGQGPGGGFTPIWGGIRVLFWLSAMKLDQFLKWKGIAGSGGRAKLLIQGGAVRVNGEVETRRGRKLRPGDRIEVGGVELRVDETSYQEGTGPVG
jgi:ribosome-associated protein